MVVAMMAMCDRDGLANAQAFRLSINDRSNEKRSEFCLITLLFVFQGFSVLCRSGLVGLYSLFCLPKRRYVCADVMTTHPFFTSQRHFLDDSSLVQDRSFVREMCLWEG